MRTDVKLGLLASFGVVLAAGWYFADRSDSENAIPLVQPEPSLTLANPPPPTPPAPPEHVSAPSRAPRPRVVTPKVRKHSTPPAAPSGTEAERRAKSSANRKEVSSIIANMLQVRRDDRPATRPPTRPAGVSAPRATKANPSPPVVGITPRKATVAKTPPAPRMETHTVKPGDTLAGIARLYYGDARYVTALRRANPGVAATALPAGSVINIPDVEIVTTPDVVPATPAQAAPLTPRRAAPAPRTYTVVPGDTLYRIALNQLGEASRWSEIHALNKAVIGDDPTALKVGLVLKLPQ